MCVLGYEISKIHIFSLHDMLSNNLTLYYYVVKYDNNYLP